MTPKDPRDLPDRIRKALDAEHHDLTEDVDWGKLTGQLNGEVTKDLGQPKGLDRLDEMDFPDNPRPRPPKNPAG